MKNKMSIMVADSDPVTIRNAWMFLNYEGHSVEGVLSGKEAIRKLKQNSYELVFTDLKLNGIDGITLIKWIKQYRPATGIVALTDTPLKKALKEAHKLGIICHIMKPFSLEMLKDVTTKAMGWVKENALSDEREEEFHPEVLAELDAVIHQYGKTPSHAIRVLLHAQEIIGYLPTKIQKRIAEGLNMFPSEIRSIVSFYSCFRTKPEGKHAPCYISGYEKAWNSVTWMTEKKALHAVNEFLKWRQVAY